MTYKEAGINYEDMDPFKIACQKRAQKTINNAERLGFIAEDWTYGESAFMFKTTYGTKIFDNMLFFSHVEESLGTKNIVADAMAKITGKSYYDQIAKCTIAMKVNDMITVGCLPITSEMHLAVGSSEWFKNEQRASDLINGWGNACDEAGCIWGGGETPTLPDIICPEASLLSGSSMGTLQYKIKPSFIEDGDLIIILESSGIHANGLTLARRIASKLPNGYETLISDGKMYGEALLDPTHLYVNFIEQCIQQGIKIHYAVNITGHGWRKFMRAPGLFSYVIEKLPKQLPIFDFIQEHGPVSDKEAYSNLNMGAGFAIFIPPEEAQKLSRIKTNLNKFHAGYIEKSVIKRVVIGPKGLEYKAETLAVR